VEARIGVRDDAYIPVAQYMSPLPLSRSDAYIRLLPFAIMSVPSFPLPSSYSIIKHQPWSSASISPERHVPLSPHKLSPYSSSFFLFNQNYVVTGGNRGIGLAITRSIASAGGSVAILYRSSPDADQVAANLSKEFSGQEFKAYKCDVTDQKRVQEVFQEVLRDFKGGMVHGVVAVSFCSSSFGVVADRLWIL
jgi:hypothetical protein